MYAFKLPDIGEGISEAQLISWAVAVGDAVEEGEEVATISTDKVDVELPAPCTGHVAELCWAAGETIQVGEVLMRIDEADEGTAAQSTVPAAEAVPPAQAIVPERSDAEQARAAGAPIVAAPSVRRLAHEQGLDLTLISGTGTDGRILQQDVEAAMTIEQVPGAPAALQSGERLAAGETRREKLTAARTVQAARLADAVHTLALSTINFEAPGDGLTALQEKLEPEAVRRGVKLSMVAMLAKCVAGALADNPRLNATIDEGRQEIIMHGDVDLGIAVAVPGRLVVPVIRGVNRLTLFETAARIAETAQRAHDGEVDAAEMRGGTFTLSSTGGLETATVLSTRPIVNPPQTAILWVSRIRDRPRELDGAWAVGPTLNASLSFDHRYIDGAEAMAFVNDVAALFACPERALA